MILNNIKYFFRELVHTFITYLILLKYPLKYDKLLITNLKSGDLSE